MCCFFVRNLNALFSTGCKSNIVITWCEQTTNKYGTKSRMHEQKKERRWEFIENISLMVGLSKIRTYLKLWNKHFHHKIAWRTLELLTRQIYWKTRSNTLNFLIFTTSNKLCISSRKDEKFWIFNQREIVWSLLC